MQQELAKGIESCEKFIFVCSKNSLKEDYLEIQEMENPLTRREGIYAKSGVLTYKVNLVTIDKYIYTGWKDSNKINMKKQLIGDFTSWEDSDKLNVAVNLLIDELKEG
jgi:hypothetical protein